MLRDMQSLARPPAKLHCLYAANLVTWPTSPLLNLETNALQVRQESAAKLEAQAQEAAQREERMAALQARRQRPPSPLSPAGATPPPAARADKVIEWRNLPSLLLALTRATHICTRCL